MSDTASSFPVIREAVGSFADRTQFRRAVAALTAAGFDPSDLSVLGSHESLAAADRDPDVVPASLADEIKYVGPLVVAGIVVVSGGPIAATIAAVVGAGIGGAALKEIFDHWTAAPHRDDFAAALAAGALLLWVRCDDAELELRALRILEEVGGRNIHVHGRPAHTDDRG